MKLNILLKCDPDKPYIFNKNESIATKLNEKQFNIVKKYNENLFKNYRFVAYKDTDFSWWDYVNKYLTVKKLYNNVSVYCDITGNLTIEK